MIKARINSTGEVVDVRPYQTEKYDFMVCRNGSIMGELYMRSELTIIGDNELDFISLVKKMREAQIEKDESDQGYRAIPHICILEKKDKLESEVDEYLKKMEEERK